MEAGTSEQGHVKISVARGLLLSLDAHTFAGLCLKSVSQAYVDVISRASGGGWWKGSIRLRRGALLQAD